MNDLKTKFQERMVCTMGHEYLRDLVWWHKSKRLLSHAEWEAALGRTLVRWSQAGHSDRVLYPVTLHSPLPLAVQLPPRLRLQC